MILEQKLLRRKRFGNLRTLQLLPHLIDFSSNDYLGLAGRELKWGGKRGSTGSRLLTGNSQFAEELEQQIAQFHGYESGLLFGCGYMANLGLISTLGRGRPTILFDAHIHASTHDGIRLSKAKALPFRHNDLEHLESRLKQSPSPCFICVDSISSTDGAIAPLAEIADLADRYGALLLVDEAHAVGVIGPQGKGVVAECRLTGRVYAQVVTFGKALGAYGAIVLGSSALREALINFATPFIYTTAPPPLILAAIQQSYEWFPPMEKERSRLRRLCSLLNAKTHICALPVRGNDQAKKMAEELMKRGFDVRPLLSPTVQRGHEVLRISLHTFNKEEEVKRLCSELKSLELELK